MRQILLIFGLISCYSSFSQTECAILRTYGDTEICMPSIEGMNESYDLVQVKNIADNTESPLNIVLAYYLNDSTYQSVDSFLNVGFDDYFKIYANKDLGTVAIAENELDEVYISMTSSLVNEGWEKIEEDFDSRFEGMEIGKPLVVDQYEHSFDARTLIMVIKYGFETKSKDVAIAMSLLRTKERLLFVAYYLQYNSEETISQIKIKSDAVVSSILEANN